MTDVNKTVIIGRITKDLDEKSYGYVANGSAKASIVIAVNRSRKHGEEWVEETSFFEVTIWGKQAENLKPYLNKGTQVCVEGYLKQDRWEKDGQKHSKIIIVAENVQLCGGNKSGNQQQKTVTHSENIDESNDFTEDIPF